MKSLRARLVVIVLLVLSSAFVLVPRNVTQRSYDPASGLMRDTVVRRVPINLGLDLKGGMHLALEIDERKGVVSDCADAIRRAERVIRTRIDEFGTTEPTVQIVGACRLVVELPGIGDPARARAIVQRSAFLEFRITDTRNQFRRALPSIDAALRRAGISTTQAQPKSAVSALLGSDSASRADSATPASGGFSSLLIESPIPGEFMVPNEHIDQVERLLAMEDVERLVPPGIELKWSSQSATADQSPYRALYALDARTLITGEDLQKAVAGRDPMTNAAEVVFELSRPAARKFAEATGRNIGNHLAILLDGRVQGQPPVIRDRIGANGRIEMAGKTLEEANDLALVLRAGALPAPLKVVEERAIGPSLGRDSIEAGVRASVLAVGFVLLVMGIYYGLAGLLAVGALFLYVLFALGGLAAFGFTLTLPGLAGFALSIGMAVDANVLIFERMREELRAGKTARLAVSEGFRHAMSAIVDSNVTTALTALILYLVGTGPVRGFAITLLIGIVASMISAVFVARTFFLLVLRARPGIHAIVQQKVRLFSNARYDFIRVRRWAYGVIAVFIVPAALLLATRGLTYSIEFTGGTLVQLETTRPVGTAAVRSALDAGGYGGAEIQSFGSERDFVVRTRLQGDRIAGREAMVAEGLTEAFDAELGAADYRIVRTEAVGPKVGGELQTKALIAILFSFLTTLIYLAFRFEWKFGLAAVVATAHDVVATIAFIALLDLEVSLVVVAGVLTVLGYSLNDTIVIFDRVREQMRQNRSRSLTQTLNLSINETLPRTILTGGTTLATALVLSFFAGEVIKPFALVMSFGIVVGTFSSIYIAAPVLLWIEDHWPRRDAPPTRHGAKRDDAPLPQLAR